MLTGGKPHAGRSLSGRLYKIQAAFLSECISALCHPRSHADYGGVLLHGGHHGDGGYFLRPTQKYIDYYSISYSYLHTVIERVRKRFPAEDCDKMEQMLSVISTELMPELDMLAKCRHPEAPAEDTTH